MLFSDLMNKPSGSKIAVDGPDYLSLRRLHWAGFHPERIDGSRQQMIKLLSPGNAFVAPPAEQARHIAALRDGTQISRVREVPAAV